MEGLVPARAAADDGRAVSSQAALLIGAIAFAFATQGAYYAPAFPVVLGAGVLAFVLAERTGGTVRPGWFPLACLGLATWSLAAGVLGGDAAGALPTALVLVATAATAATVRRAGRNDRRALLRTVLVLGAVLALTGWTGVAFRAEPWGIESQHLWRAATTITYANVAGAILAAASLIAISLRTTRPRALLPAAAAFVTLAGLGATLSRAAIGAFALGLLALVAVLGPRRVLGAAAAPAMGAAVALAGLLPTVPASEPARPLLAMGALTAGAAVALALGRLRARAAIGIGLAVVAITAAAFLATGAVADIGAKRLTLASPARSAETRAAIELALARPISGWGPGNASLMWDEGGTVVAAEYVHNEFLQTFAESGAVGLALLVGVIAAAAVVVARGRRAIPQAEWAGPAAALTALVFHSAFDFLWHVPVVPVMAGLLVGLAGPPAEREERA